MRAGERGICRHASRADSYACAGDGCSFSFDLAGPRRGEGKGFVEACKKFYAAFYMSRADRARASADVEREPAAIAVDIPCVMSTLAC